MCVERISIMLVLISVGFISSNKIVEYHKFDISECKQYIADIKC